MKNLLFFALLAIGLMSCTKEISQLNWVEIPSEFWYNHDDGNTTVTYGGNPIKTIQGQPRMMSVQTTFAAHISVGHFYADGDNYIFLAKDGLVYKEYKVPYFTSAEVISNTLFLYRGDGDEVFNIAL